MSYVLRILVVYMHCFVFASSSVFTSTQYILHHLYYCNIFSSIHLYTHFCNFVKELISRCDSIWHYEEDVSLSEARLQHTCTCNQLHSVITHAE